MSKVDLSVQVGSLKFRNPILLASGTVGYGNEISEFIDLTKIGGIVTKSLSLKPRKGNPPQRIVETPAGMLNAIGLQNVGVEEFLKEKIPFLKKFDVPLICNIAASTLEEYVECTRLLTSEEFIKGFEINVSCPNVKEGGLQFGNDPIAVGKITQKVKAVTNKPIIVKLSPNVSYISEFARVVKEEGGDAVSAINTLVGTSFNINTRKPKIFNVFGGLSGPAIKPIALAKVLEIKQKVDIPIFGVGGIMNWKDVVEFMIVGASAVQIGTLNFIDPTASGKMISDLENYCTENNIQKISELTGSFSLDN
ncbi:MAG: dihydroorotate dehydrogenase B catalytic subunit [Ignavibacteria bacterium RIFOXYB2_FULL_35_12]|nr:MAG: dihydroorotate dehydrogenase B catalytic subunit [Ignavibacteria bacterium GWA2_36_19]OGU49679.1 MAG: dihydroorotate dehydrogenase B catalytic subunit [Ignavibacteria bacterium GWC2_35_8]OGU62202.1 MAG: dihydroorotate dehydrogenase B catalytic subunit [Ignavibacteria bacterium GWF2_35_20]OGU81086.1 MAG: dihydroorotate dehydrogenase B catalytic subunit [Ignavibacteria bacterium RIFOXYA2_FULL_35_9]OGU84315.1 MAG: dihydroorotate dehydrogenase B catalytic subunit [Ignavibacteria bacterium R